MLYNHRHKWHSSKLKKSLQRGKDDDAANHIVALDIGTEFAKALIARIDGQEMSVVGVGARQDVSDMHSGAISDIGGVVRACEEALSGQRSGWCAG